MDGERTWVNAVERLRRIVRDDEKFVQAGLNADRNRARAITAELYVRYMVISNVLTVYHDMFIQSQLRILIKKLIMCIYGRIHEIKQILIKEDSSIYTPVIEQLVVLKVTYDQFELKVPRCFRDERQTFLKEINNEIDEINNRTELENNNSNPSEIRGEDEQERREEDKYYVELNEHFSSVGQSISQQTLESGLDVVTLMCNDQPFIPERFREITVEEILRTKSIKLLQKYIRAMRDRIFVNELLAARRTRENIISGKYMEPSKEKARVAAIRIQRYWRWYRLLRRTKVRTQKRNVLLGMQMSSERSNLNIEHELSLEDEIWSKQIEANAELKNVIKICLEKLNKNNKYEIIEEIEDELRTYIKTFYETCMHLPSWPDPTPIIFTDNDVLGLPPIILSENVLKNLNIPPVRYKSALNQQVPLGGSAIFHTGRWMTTEMAKILAPLIVEFQNKPAKERKKLTNELKEKKKIEKEKIVENSKLAAKNREEKRALGMVLEPSDLTELFKETFDEFDRNWKIYDVLDNQPREDLVKTEIYGTAQIQLRATADITVKEELNRLQKALDIDSGKKYKAPKEKSTESKAKSKDRLKEDKLPNPKEILEELVKNNMIKKSSTVKFEEFQGEVFCSGSALRSEPYNLDPPYNLGDVRQIIKELFVIGLIFPEVRKLKQIKFSSSLLIAGPDKSGKTLLTNAICTETGSLKIELTLKNVSENYPNPTQISQLIKIIVKFALTYQPVVIEVDLADVPFYKKIPNDLKPFKPKLMARVLTKLLKSIKNTERVLIVGKATKPWLTAGKKLTNVFETVVFTVSDYNTIFMFLNNSLMSYPAISREFPVTSLTTMLASYPRQVVLDILAEVMTKERVLKLRNVPLDPTEFVPVMMKYPKMKPTELRDRYYDWYRQCTTLRIKKS